MLPPCLRQLRVVALAGMAIAASMAGANGIPDSLRLESPTDIDAFRRWFTFLAEAQYYNNEKSRPSEIIDCSSLLRYAYREALRNHDGAWARTAQLPLIPALPSVKQYNFPRTPIGAALFRVRVGDYRDSDRGDGTFTLFADAKTLRRFNTFFISRDVRSAQPGDLIFFQTEGVPDVSHSMIYLGPSQFERSEEQYAVYHTGPSGGTPGDLRRRSVRELMNYPDPRWRPTPANRSFTGVFRWKILEQTQWH